MPRRPISPPVAEALERLTDRTDRIVVMDTETTGFGAQDRVVEIAMVTLDLRGRVVDRWATLLDPGRDPGPTHVHGITGEMLQGAPDFGTLAPEIAARLHGAVVSAHNLPFDARMLRQEFDRYDVPVGDLRKGLDTLVPTRAKLHVACRAEGVRLQPNHHALDDALATADLLLRILDRFETAPEPVTLEGPVDAADRTRSWTRSGTAVDADPSRLVAGWFRAAVDRS